MSVSGLLALCFSTVLAENYVLVRFLGVGPLIGASGRRGAAAPMWAAVAAVSTVSSALAWVIYNYLLAPFGLEYLQIIVFVAVIALLVELFGALCKRCLPELYGTLKPYLPLVATNSAVLGAALFNVQFGGGFVQSVLYGFLGSLGFGVALFAFCGVRRRLELAAPPKSFEGAPLALVALGLIAMVFWGLRGVSFGGGSTFPFSPAG